MHRNRLMQVQWERLTEIIMLVWMHLITIITLITIYPEPPDPMVVTITRSRYRPTVLTVIPSAAREHRFERNPSHQHVPELHHQTVGRLDDTASVLHHHHMPRDAYAPGIYSSIRRVEHHSTKRIGLSRTHLSLVSSTTVL